MHVYHYVFLYPGGLIAWILAGLIAGWLAGLLVRGQGYGCLGDIALGLVGAFIGGIIVALLPIPLPTTQHFIGTTIIAFIGAFILAGLGRLIGGGSRSRGPRYPRSRYP
jgi:uncharacterized membrane protein YeaQ/YmgE (transglycosylase-associated protein family)